MMIMMLMRINMRIGMIIMIRRFNMFKWLCGCHLGRLSILSVARHLQDTRHIQHSSQLLKEECIEKRLGQKKQKEQQERKEKKEKKKREKKKDKKENREKKAKEKKRE